MAFSPKGIPICRYVYCNLTFFCIYFVLRLNCNTRESAVVLEPA